MFSVGKIKYYRDLSRFFITRSVKGFCVPDEPYFDKEPADLFMSLIHDCQFYLEYGSGGSTVVAAKLNKPFISVDTDRFFLKSVGKKIGTLSSDQRLVHADIGLTGPWGMPLRTKNPSPRRLKKWEAYAGVPWRYISDDYLPDLILIDGRFRVASALTCFTNLAESSNTKILVDDYVDRPHYHVMEKYAKLSTVHGRMAVFQPSSRDKKKLCQTIEDYSTDWR